MQINPNEIESIDEIGELDGNPVKLVKCVGGFFMTIGQPKGKTATEVLSTGSHAAIAKYAVEKTFRSFRPSMEKNETLSLNEKVTGLSELLPKDLRDKGYDLYSLKKNEDIDYVVTKYNSEKVTFSAINSDNSFIVTGPEKSLTEEESGTTSAIIKAMSRDAHQLQKENIVFRNKAFKVKDLMKK